MIEPSNFPSEDGKIKELRLSRLTIELLFGTYDYDAVFSEESRRDGFAFLYADNGLGKTTILWLIFHLLSSERMNGHRHAISKIAFRLFAVTLSDGTEISATRAAAVSGPFVQRVRLPSGEEISLDMPKTKSEEGADAPEYARMCRMLGQQEVRLLAHNRVFFSSEQELPAARHSIVRRADIFALEHRYAEIQMRDKWAPDEDVTLSAALLNATDWIRRQALSLRDSGTNRTDRIYTSLLNQISSSAFDESADPVATIEKLKIEIDELSARSETFSAFDLSPRFNVDKMRDALTTLAPKRVDSAAAILMPYLKGIRARLEELDSLRNMLTVITESLTSLYSYKTVHFGLQAGFSFRSSISDSTIDPQWLSSGERHLLTIVCSAISCRSSRTIVLIDEPEISLNVKWQRQLLRLLRVCLDPRGNFALLATHSLEMLSGYRKTHVIRLVPHVANLAPRVKIEEEGQ